MSKTQLTLYPFEADTGWGKMLIGYTIDKPMSDNPGAHEFSRILCPGVVEMMIGRLPKERTNVIVELGIRGDWRITLYRIGTVVDSWLGLTLLSPTDYPFYVRATFNNIVRHIIGIPEVEGRKGRREIQDIITKVTALGHGYRTVCFTVKEVDDGE